MILTTLFMVSCHERSYNPNAHLSLESYESLDSNAFALNSHRIREQINQLIRVDIDSMTADYRTKSYYLRRGDFIWINRHGVDYRADTLLSYLRRVDTMGFSLSKFRVNQIERDLWRLRHLDFDTASNRINLVAARLEYNLTKAYLRYTVGQRFGFMNPTYTFNRLDVHDSDSVHVSYRSLYDIPMQHASKGFFAAALRKVSNDSVAEFLREVQPASPFYHRLQRLIPRHRHDAGFFAKLLVNMERCRWRLEDYPQAHAKYVLVNIPAYALRAVDGDNEPLEMRIGCGSFDTKTPLLTSQIKRMDINPQWIIPNSIRKKSIIKHAGDSGYFVRNHYFVRERKNGRRITGNNITPAMLLSPDYLVIQEGGEGNALGRIIFRFDNAYSIYLHDTSSRSVFGRDDRSVSHGCVRVEKPFDLAVFLLEDKDDRLISKIQYSMSADVSMLNHKAKEDADGEEKPDTLDRSKIIGSVKVEPTVPVFITYFTLYPDVKGNIRTYADVYGYDKVIYDILKNYR